MGFVGARKRGEGKSGVFSLSGRMRMVPDRDYAIFDGTMIDEWNKTLCS